MKIALLSSSGGHFEELSCLKSIAKKHDAFIITERSGLADTPVAWAGRTYRVRQINRRELLFIPRFVALFFLSWRILRRENPDCVISTGALATYPFCLLAKWRHKSVIYIESFARVDHPSLTGRCMVRVADLFIVQWEELLKHYPKAVYTGGIF